MIKTALAKRAQDHSGLASPFERDSLGTTPRNAQKKVSFKAGVSPFDRKFSLNESPISAKATF